jgi:anti-sigma regulatory factor (Ser/Thr protein kinase)
VIWVGSFKSLQSVLCRPRFDSASLKVHTWARSEIALISPLADWLTRLIHASHCVPGKEEFVELALREGLSNAILHGNRLDARKLVHVRCCCERTKGMFIVIRDQGHGFNPDNVPDPLAVENLNAEHGRGIHLMRLAMDEVSFERRGTEVHMRKQSESEQGTPVPYVHNRIVQRLETRPSPGVRIVDLHVSMSRSS